MARAGQYHRELQAEISERDAHIAKLEAALRDTADALEQFVGGFADECGAITEQVKEARAALEDQDG